MAHLNAYTITLSSAVSGGSHYIHYVGKKTLSEVWEKYQKRYEPSFKVESVQQTESMGEVSVLSTGGDDA